MKTLYYVADPMCSWCWGFQPVLEKVKEAVPERVITRIYHGRIGARH